MKSNRNSLFKKFWVTLIELNELSLMAQNNERASYRKGLNLPIVDCIL